MSILLGWHVVDVDGCVLLELEPVAAAAPLVLAGDQPHPLDGRVALLARAADHSVLREEAAGEPFNKCRRECFFNSYVQGVPSACTEFPIPSFVRFCHVLSWGFPCPAWAVAS